MLSKRKKINIRFIEDRIVCAKSPIECRNCIYKSECENLDLYYYVYENIRDTMKARSYKRGRHGAIVEKR